MNISDALSRASWYDVLDGDAQDRVRDTLVLRALQGGAFICRKGEPVDYWFGVIEGLAKICSDSCEGKTITFTGVAPGGWFGEGSVLKMEPRRYDAMTLRDSVIAFLPRATFTWLLDHSIPFNRYLLVQLNERLGQFIGTVEYDRLLSTDARVARCLAALFNPVLYPGIGAHLPISQEEIGYLCGISRQRANQALRNLEARALVRVEYGALIVEDLAGLRAFEA